MTVPASALRGEGFWRIAFRRLRRNRPAMLGLAVILLFLAIAVLAPFLAPYEPTKSSFREALQGPSLLHPMGTDKLGRDVLSRVMVGTSNSIRTGVLAVFWACLIGCAMGAVAGAAGGLTDTVVMRLTDVLLAFPGILLAIGIVSWLGRGEMQLTFAVGMSMAPTFTRLLRARLLALRQADFVLALRSVGVRPLRILFRHMLPNALTPLIVQATLTLGTTIVTVAGLGFLGLGPEDPRIPEWGGMLIEGAQLMQTSPHLVMAPGACLVALVLAVNLFGDGLRDALDPRVRR